MTTPVPEVHVRRKSAPDPLDYPLSLKACKRILAGCVLLVVLVVVVQIWRGRNHEYQRMEAENVALTARAVNAERQLAEMLRHGDNGILVANIGPELAGYQLRLMPKKPGRN